MRTINVTICGAGRTGHLSAVLFKQQPALHVSVLTGNKDVEEQWRHDAAMAWSAEMPDGSIVQGRPDCVSMKPADAVHNADIIILTVPAQARQQNLQMIADHLPYEKPVFVGAIPGFCGFDWLAEKELGQYKNVIIWGMKDVPHTAFALQPGKHVRLGGMKEHLYAALHRRERHENRQLLHEHLTHLYTVPVSLLDDYMEVTLTPGNPLMHPPVLYALLGPNAPWQNKAFEHPICWWSQCPYAGAKLIESCDRENQLLCRAVERRLGIDLSSVHSLKQEIIEAYGEQIADQQSIYSVLRTNHAYDDIKAPLVPNPDGPGLIIDRNSRAFHEDIAFGQGLLVEMAKRLDIDIPHIFKTYNWAHDFHGALSRTVADYVPLHWPEAA